MWWLEDRDAKRAGCCNIDCARGPGPVLDRTVSGSGCVWCLIGLSPTVLFTRPLPSSCPAQASAGMCDGVAVGAVASAASNAAAEERWSTRLHCGRGLRLHALLDLPWLCASLGMNAAPHHPVPAASSLPTTPTCTARCRARQELSMVLGLACAMLASDWPRRWGCLHRLGADYEVRHAVSPSAGGTP